MASTKILLVAALDFGTTFSGWAYAFKHDYMFDPSKIYAKNWNNGENISNKTPTTVLIQPDGETFEAFGYEAEDKYAALAAENKHGDYYYFSRFKMMLQDRQDFHTNIFLEDAFGKRLPAKDVFKHAIRFLKNDLKQNCLRGIKHHINEVKWVLTVPAIWSEMAKHFMREAAEEAGIPSSTLKISLEPEAASLFYWTTALGMKANNGSKICSLKTGTKYIVLDAGGGTVDIAVHEILHSGNLRELYIASGGAWGGTTVDEAYKHMLIGIFGQAVFTKFKNDYTNDYLRLFRSFEVVKRRMSKATTNDIVINLPVNLVETYKEETESTLEVAVQSSELSSFIKVVKGNKLKIEPSCIIKLFSTFEKNTVQHISKLLSIKGVSEVKTLIMVGGFSESSYVQETIKQSFPDLDVLVPKDPSLAVLKGAVLFGYKPTAVVERKVRFTYGIEVYLPFKEGIHPDEKLRQFNQERYCAEVFEKVVEAGHSVKLNERIQLSSTVRSVSSELFRISLYGSPEICPSYVTDKSCFLIGTFVVKFDEIKPENLNKNFIVSYVFGATEITAEVEEVETKKIYSAQFKLIDS